MKIPPRILVTGAAGFIGSSFVRAALAAGYQVTGLDLLSYAGHRENVADLDAGAFSLEVGDIRDGALLKRLLFEQNPVAVVNFAAESHVDRSVRDPLRFVDVNVRGTAELLEAGRHYRDSLPAGAAREAFRFLQVSTDEVYGSLGAQGAFTEESPLAPSSPYSASKAAADHLALAWHRTYGLPVVITRSSNNFGPRQHPEKFIPRMIEAALTEERLPIYGNGENVRDWVHVEDTAAGLLAALRRGRPGGVYGLGGGHEERNIDLAQMICAILDELRPRPGGVPYAAKVAFVADRPGHDFRYAMDSSLAARELGFCVTTPFAARLRETVEWYLAHEAWVRAVRAGPVS